MSTFSYREVTNSWFYRYKLYHIPFWCVYHYLWLTVAFANPMKAAVNIVNSPYSIKYIFYVVFEAAAVYFNLYFLIPRFLERRKFIQYFLLLSATIVATALFIVFGYYAGAFVTSHTLKELYGDGANCFYYFMGYALPSAFASMMLAMTIKLTKHWLQNERRQQILEKDKLETELQLLKQQFNPHFLFNSINSIFFLIHKNPDMASDSLAKFSDLLRHQLYECNEHQIFLTKELTYLKNFAELEKLRQGKKLKVDIYLPEKLIDDLGIAPFVLMTFVENAFKHVSENDTTGTWIKIFVAVKGHTLNLRISNSKTLGRTVSAPHHSGIGLKNVRRRLDLVYPNAYSLDLIDSPDQFISNLDITLCELKKQNDYELQTMNA